MRCVSVVLMVVAMVRLAGAAAPTISAVSVVPQDTWAMVNWTTSQSANSYVDYGPTASYGSTESISTLSTGHKVQLNNLTAATTYHYRIRSANSGGEIASTADATFTTGAIQYGCEINPTGNPIGGGGGYNRIVNRSQATVVVSTASALKSALSTAKSGNIIYVDDDAIVDLSPQTATIYIPAGVTLASGRGNNGSAGALLFNSTFTSTGSPPMFRTNGTGVRITGLRIAGPHNWVGRTLQMYHGIYAGHADCEIDNCEITGFNYAAYEAVVGKPGAYFHHNYIHRNTRDGVGYGACPGWNNVSILEGNIFDYDRHAIAGNGTTGQSYEARYNLVGEYSIRHVFDMHGGYDRGDGTQIAGTIMRIHHNTVRNDDEGAVCIRGIPTVGCWVNNNRFYRAHDSWCIRQLVNGTAVTTYDHFWEFNDLFGADAKTISPSSGVPDPAAGTMIGNWKLDEGSGLTTADSSGNGHTGTLKNLDAATCWVTGHSGKAVQLPGGTSEIDCGTINQLDNFALDFWVKFNDLSTTEYVLANNVFDLYFRGGTTGNNLWFRFRTVESTPGGDITAWSYRTGIKSSTLVTVGTWYHVVLTRSGNTLRIFINDVLERELDCLSGKTIDMANFGNFRLAPSLIGVIDEFKYFIPGASSTGGHAPTLTWSGETNFTDGGVYPKTGANTSNYTFHVKYTDADGDEPMLGYPRLHLLRGGVEFEYFTPAVMFPVNASASVKTGRIYTYKVKLPRGSEYSYYFEARDTMGNTATGPATTPTAGPTITGGNAIPVLYPFSNSADAHYVDNIPYPASSGTAATNFDFRAMYIDIDNDAPQTGNVRLKITNSSNVEINGSPFYMTAADTRPFACGKFYQFYKRFPTGSYKYQVLATDAMGAVAPPFPSSLKALTVSSSPTNWTDLYSGAPSRLASNSFVVNAWFSQSVTGFTQSDVNVTNGTISGFSGSGSFYTFTVTAANYGAVTVSVPTGVTSPSSPASATLTRTWTAPWTAAGKNWISYGDE